MILDTVPRMIPVTIKYLLLLASQTPLIEQAVTYIQKGLKEFEALYPTQYPNDTIL